MTDPVTQLAKEATVMDCLARFRKLQRDLLFVRYGGDWRGHATDPEFFGPMTGADALVLEMIALYAEYGFPSMGSHSAVEDLEKIKKKLLLEGKNDLAAEISRVMIGLYYGLE